MLESGATREIALADSGGLQVSIVEDFLRRGAGKVVCVFGVESGTGGFDWNSPPEFVEAKRPRPLSGF